MSFFHGVDTRTELLDFNAIDYYYQESSDKIKTFHIGIRD